MKSIVKTNLIMLLLLGVIATNPLHASEPCEQDVATVRVNGMVCDFCARALEKIFSKRDEVKDIAIDLSEGTVTISHKAGQQIDDEMLTQLVTDSGYSVVGITHSCGEAS